VIERLRPVLEADPRIAYAIVFGSRGRGSAHDGSDTDLGVGLVRGTRLSAAEIGELVSRLESAVQGRVDLVLLDEVGPGLAYRALRDGRVVFEKDRSALVERKTRVILEYLDFRPVEETFAHAVLAAGRRG
jgi:predicted nucleotidyltransferase